MTALDLTKGAPFTGPLTTTTGTPINPAISFGTPTVGLYRLEDQLHVSVNGTSVAYFDGSGLAAPSGIVGRTNDPRGLDIIGWDGSLQFRVGTNILAEEFFTVMGGVPTVGATLYTASDTQTNVNANIAMQGAGSLIVGNFNTKFLYVTPPTATAVAPALTLSGTADGTVVSISCSAPASASGIPVVNVAVCPQNNGAFQLSVTDGTAAGGNARGVNAVDLQAGRAAATAVAAAPYSFVAGYGNTIGTGANGGSAIGYSHLVNGRWSSMIGQNGNDRFRYGFQGYSTGIFTAQGDAQIGQTYFRGKSTNGAAVVLTADAAAPGTANVLPISANSAAALKFMLTGRDLATTGTACAWFQTGLLTRDSTAASTTLALGTATTLGTAPTVTVTADATYNGLHFSVTPGNAHSWDFLVRIDVAEVA